MKPEDGYIVYIINPKSGASSNKLVAWQFAEYLKKKGFDLRIQFTKSLPHAYELAAEAAVQYECKLVVAAGGDGTIREIAHGLEGSDKTLLIVPCGTENLLANELGFDERLKTIIKTFKGDFTHPLDLGSVNGKSFTSVVGLGFDGHVVKRVSRQREGHIHHFDYFWPLWRTFWNYGFPEIRVEIEGETIYEGRGIAFIGNISRYAVGLEICRYADYSDGLLDVCIYKCSSRIELVKHSVMTILKRHSDMSSVIYRQAKSIRVSSPAAEVATEIDGDPGPSLPIEISVIPQAVKVLIPEDGKPAGVRTRFMRMLG